jgi:antitoxin VapB
MAMNQVARLFTNGRSQAVRLPAAYRFNTKEVFIRQDPENVPPDFLDEQERRQGSEERDPFKGWSE